MTRPEWIWAQLTTWQMIYIMLAFSFIAGGLCVMFPSLAPVAFIIMIVLFVALIAFVFQLLLYWLYRNGYSSSGALNIMVIIALILPFLKAAAGGVIAGGMADGFAHDCAFAHDGAVSHEGLVKAPSGYHHVNGYTRIAPDGHTEYVHDYIRSTPDGILENNLSYHGNHPIVEGTYQAIPGEGGQAGKQGKRQQGSLEGEAPSLDVRHRPPEILPDHPAPQGGGNDQPLDHRVDVKLLGDHRHHIAEQCVVEGIEQIAQGRGEYQHLQGR